MKPRLLGLALAGIMLVSAPASAMVLSLTAGGVADTVPGNFNPGGFPGGVSVGDPITVFDSGSPGGLSLSGPATLRFEFFGSEASEDDTFSFSGINFNNATPVGTQGTAAFAGGVIPFLFTTTNGGGLNATNGGPFDSGLSIAFANLGGNSFLAMFNDGSGIDSDRDDMVVKVSVSQVPLPAAVWLLLSAVLGLVSFARVRRNGPQAA